VVRCLVAVVLGLTENRAGHPKRSTIIVIRDRYDWGRLPGVQTSPGVPGAMSAPLVVGFPVA